MDEHTKALLIQAAQGLEDALRMAGHGESHSMTLGYLTPQGRLRRQADEMDRREAKMAELVALWNLLKEATK